MTIILNQTKPPDQAAVATGKPPADEARSVAMRGNRIDSRDIFQSAREIIIAHGEDSYRLRLTAQNKLILTK